MIQWIQAHQFWAGTISMAIISNAIGAMPTPHDGSGAFYSWFFKFAQGIGGAIPRLLAIYSPNTLTALTGQAPKETIPPNPPIPASELPEVTKP